MLAYNWLDIWIKRAYLHSFSNTEMAMIALPVPCIFHLF